MSQAVDTVIVGGGQSGLATSYYLKLRDCEHVVLEQASQPGDAWRNGRWDSFTLVTPNWAFRLPGAEYSDDAPDAFMPRNEVVARLERYVQDNDLPVRFETKVASVQLREKPSGYLVTTNAGDFEARNVVMATGLFQGPRIPEFSSDISASVTQLHSGQYRSPGSIPDGAVLVVGSAQSGCQIADELRRSGRSVYLCVGGAGRVPRRYRGKDIVEWLDLAGWFDQTVESLPSPRAKFAANPHVSGRDGGQSLNLHQFARDGVVLLGHLLGADNNRIVLAPDLKESLAKADRAEAEILRMVDAYIERSGLDVAAEELPALDDGYRLGDTTNLDLTAAGITCIVWAVGYTFDFGLVELPVFDSDGYPVQDRGVTGYAGLYFVGLPWLHTRKSGLFLGIGEDAEHVAASIAGGSS
jgi:putative flavoprotein involved in K+ transport